MYVDRMLRPAYRSREERTRNRMNGRVVLIRGADRVTVQHSKARENARRAEKLREQAQKCPS